MSSFSDYEEDSLNNYDEKFYLDYKEELEDSVIDLRKNL